MIIWQFLCVIGISFLILEMFTPSMFFLNFSLAAFFTAIISIYTKNYMYLSFAFVFLSFLSFIFLRPILLKKNKRENNTGIEDKYINKIAKAIEDITETSGAISIYDERWEAKNIENSIINTGEQVIIVKNENLTMYVKKINN